MRKKYKEQLPLMGHTTDHPHAVEMELIDKILERTSIIYEMALQDLTREVKSKETGANGMSAEQIVKAAIIKQSRGFSYEDLAFHIVDSGCYRKFMKIGFADKGFSPSALCANIKALSPETWEAVNRVVVAYANETKVERGRKVRIDCTVVPSNIHKPFDSTLLWDSVRVLTRLLKNAKDLFPDAGIIVKDHTKRAKRGMLGVMNAKGKKAREKQYRDLLFITGKTAGYAQRASSVLEKLFPSVHAVRMVQELSHYIDLAQKVIDQTQRRVLQGESVPASEKVVSIFEPHTDIIIKDNRDTYYGHKICLTGGASNLILDCEILEGNPADVTLVKRMLENQKMIYDKYPSKVSLDGGFASADNLELTKGTMKIKDVCFAKKRGLNEEDMCKSSWIYKNLRNFRAGIESGISWLKRCFGLARCTWKTFESFKSYVWASIVSANLLTLARKQMA